MQNKVAKRVNDTLAKLKAEFEWKEVPASVEISAKLEMTCKYILQRGTARQLVEAAKRSSASATKTVNAKSKTAGPVDSKPLEKTTTKSAKSQASEQKLLNTQTKGMDSR